jgi:4-amino-4-deoxy-L-arabinose transferase-like glycosyltransferase
MSAIRRHAYVLGLVLAGALAAVVRFANVLIWRPTCDGDLVSLVEAGQPLPEPTPPGCWQIGGDSAYGYLQGRMIARGDWFIDSAAWVGTGGKRLVPSAGDPPLYALYLSFFNKLGLTSVTSARLVSAVAGIAGVVLIGIVARRIAGPRAGVIAAILAAVTPMLWINDAMLLSEALYVPMIALAMLAGYHFWQKPTLATSVLMGAVIAIAALTRAESILLFGFMVLPLAWGLKELTLGRRAVLAVVSGLVGLAVLAPWFVYNAARFEQPVFMTSGTGAVLLAGSCEPAFRGEFIGYYGANCYDEYIRYGFLTDNPDFPGCDTEARQIAFDFPDGGQRTREQNLVLARCYPDPLTLDESQRDAVNRALAQRYLADNKRQLPIVMAARVGRMWDLYAPGQNTQLNWQVEGRGELASIAGLWTYYAQIPFAIGGLMLLVRRRIPVSPLLAMAGVITVTAAITFGATRYRVPADVMIVILAAVGIEALVAWRWPAGDTGTISRRRGARTPDGRAPDATPAPDADPGRGDPQPPPELTHV